VLSLWQKVGCWCGLRVCLIDSVSTLSHSDI
jgi:hypothetical protein